MKLACKSMWALNCQISRNYFSQNLRYYDSLWLFIRLYRSWSFLVACWLDWHLAPGRAQDSVETRRGMRATQRNPSILTHFFTVPLTVMLISRRRDHTRLAQALPPAQTDTPGVLLTSGIPHGVRPPRRPAASPSFPGH